MKHPKPDRQRATGDREMNFRIQMPLFEIVAFLSVIGLFSVLG